MLAEFLILEEYGYMCLSGLPIKLLRFIRLCEIVMGSIIILVFSGQMFLNLQITPCFFGHKISDQFLDH